MDFVKLEVFAKVVQCGNFSKAAKELYLTQPSVSARIESLEKELRTTLFERRGRKTVLTVAGKDFYPYALEMIRLKEESMASITRVQNHAEGKIVFYASSTPGVYLLPSLLKTFHLQNPQVNYDITLTNTDKTIKAILEYEADLGLVGSVAANNLLAHEPIIADELVLITPKNHFKTKTKLISIQDIQQEKLIIRKKGSATRKTFVQALEKEGLKIDDFKVFLEIDNLEGIKECVSSGLGVSIVSKLCLKKGDDLDFYFLEGISLARNIYLVFHKNKVFSTAGDRFLQAFSQKDGDHDHEKNIPR